MQRAQNESRGFTLITSLLLLVLLTGLACGLLMMVTTEQRSGGYDLNHNYTYHATEGAMEKMSSDLANLFQTIQAPSSAQICALSNNYPTWDSTVSFSCSGSCAYNVAGLSKLTGLPTCSDPLLTYYGPISAGSEQGLYAQIMPVVMNTEGQRPTGETVSLTRTAEVALIPVFQFGVFSDSDLFFGQSPHLGFSGRVHTNGDLYLGVANGYNLVFGDKLAAFGNVIREQMDNGVVVGNGLDDGTVLIPTGAGGCATELNNIATATASSTCVSIAGTALGSTLGSVVDGHGSAQNTASWKSVSLGTYNGYLIDGNGNQTTGQTGTNNTGATDLTLPFVSGASSSEQVQIIRQPLPGESTTSALGAARLANEAQIRILLSDTEAGLHPTGSLNDQDDVYLSSFAPAGFNGFGNTAFSSGGINVNNTGHYYSFGESWCGVNSGACLAAEDPNFVVPYSYEGPLWTSLSGTPTEWPIIGGWLRVEVVYASDGNWHGVTREWLGLGFARGLNVPTVPGQICSAATNTVPSANALPTSANYTTVLGCNFLPEHINAILYFQQTADRDGDGSIGINNSKDIVQTSGSLGLNQNNYSPTANTKNYSQYNWYPINLYEAREGENNDTRSTTFPYSTTCGGASCTNNTGNSGIPTGTPNGIMNAVELDVGNLNQWLLGKTGTNGPNVNYTSQNGYILYFSDRRGEQVTTASTTAVCSGCPAGSNAGEYGFEDTVNYAGGAPYMPNNSLEPNNYNGISPEDVNGNLQLDVYGVKGVGDAFGSATATATDSTVPANPYNPRVYTFTVGRANRVTGARHVLKLVDASLGNVPTQPPGNANNNCAFVNPNTGAAQPTGCGGFTVASENPVYIQGNYNSNCPAKAAASVFSSCTYGNTNYDPTWPPTNGNEPNHAAASIIADAVTMLSNNWQDGGALNGTNAPPYTEANTYGSLANPVLTPLGENTNAPPAYYPDRLATTTYYRVAIAAGKNIAFDNLNQKPEFAFGMDGGVHNFLRFLEDWGGIPTGLGGPGTHAQLYYKGSIVSLYWSMYDTGTFKCCNLVYAPPDRQYQFDSLFSIPSNLPPGTPMFRNVDNLSYRENQVARTN
jgi:hypothetical protein